MEVDLNNTGEFLLIGTSPILSVPYSLDAGNTLSHIPGQARQIIHHNGSEWDAYNHLSISSGKVVIDAAHNNDTLPIFEIRNQNGEVLFTITNTGVKISLPDQTNQGSFYVTGKNTAIPYLTVSPDSTNFNFISTSGKSTKGGFAVGGLSTGKPNSINYFRLTPAGTDLFFERSTTKSTKGGFAIGGLGNNKIQLPYFVLNPDSIRFYIDNDSTKSTKGGFAVGGLGSGKTSSFPILSVLPWSSQLLFDNTTNPKSGKGGFAVGGISSGKSNYDYFHIAPTQTSFLTLPRNKGAIGGFSIGEFTDSANFVNFLNLSQDTLKIFNDFVIPSEINISGDITYEGAIITPPMVSTDTVLFITSSGATAFGTINDNGNADSLQCGFVWSLKPSPTITTNMGILSIDTILIGSFDGQLKNLLPDTIYYVRAFAKNSAGINYGRELLFRTLPALAFVPTRIDSTFYRFSANIKVLNIPMVYYPAGIIWDTTETVSFTQKSGIYSTFLMQDSISAFAQVLKPNTTYYWKAFLILNGTDTVLSQTFSTRTTHSPITIFPIDEITNQGAFVEGGPAYLGYPYSTQAGFVWGTSPNIDTVNNIGKVNLTPGYFTDLAHLITGLSEQQTYYVRAWAIFLDSIAFYSEALPFTTESLYNTITDIDGNTYQTKFIGRYCWMLTNLRTTKYNDGSPINPSHIKMPAPEYSAQINRFGRLYSFQSVAQNVTSGLSNRKLCPTGWKLPDNSEWNDLFETTNDPSNVVKHLKADDPSWLPSAVPNENTTEFSALPAGRYTIQTVGMYDEQGKKAIFWSKPWDDPIYTDTDIKILSFNDPYIYSEAYVPGLSPDPYYGSVRCVKAVNKKASLESWVPPYYTHNSVLLSLFLYDTGNAETGEVGVLIGNSPNLHVDNAPIKISKPLKYGNFSFYYDSLSPETQYFIRSYALNEKGISYDSVYEFVTDSTMSVIDINGNKYPITTIAEQQWMTQNLRVSSFNNANYLYWDDYTLPSSSYSNVLHGNYYKFRTFTDQQGLCPQGWNIPRREDFQEMIDSLSGTSIAGKHLKINNFDTNSGYWEEAMLFHDNTSGFSALPAGYYDNNNGYIDITRTALFATQSLDSDGNLFMMRLTYNSDFAEVGTYSNIYSDNDKKYTIRCIKNNPQKQYEASLYVERVDFITSNRAKVKGHLVDSGNCVILKHGVCYGQNTNIDTSSFKVELGPRVTNFETEITELTPGTTLYVRNYVETTKGLSYGAIYEINVPSQSAPQVEIIFAKSDSLGKATLFGNVIFNGYSTIHSLGFEIDTDDTFNNPIIVNVDTRNEGMFSAQVEGLLRGEVYYVRAFIGNEVSTSYSDILSFISYPFTGTGTIDDPFLIDNIYGLIYLSENSNLWNRHFKLESDIDGSITNQLNGGNGFSPIGKSDHPFTGSFNGDDFFISNIYINRAEQEIGLFGATHNAIIQNIVLDTIQINFGTSHVGALIGKAINTMIRNIIIDNANIGSDGSGSYLGGIVGYMQNCQINKSAFEGYFTTYQNVSNAGGIAGYAVASTIDSSFSKNPFVDILGNGHKIGGLIGEGVDLNISNSYSTIDINNLTISHFGGLIGYLHGTTSLIQNCYTQGFIENSNDTTGGFIAYAENCTIRNCYSNCEIVQPNQHAFIKYANNVTLENCYFNKQNAPTDTYAIGLNPIKFARKRTFQGWDFESVWNINEFGSYPYLQWQTDISHNQYDFPYQVDGDGNKYGVIEIGGVMILDENLMTTKFNNGTPINNVTDSSDWTNQAGPAYCWYNNDSASYARPFGALYNHYVINGPICPGSFVPITNAILNTILTRLANDGYSTNPGFALKSRNVWNNPGNDDYGFEGFPSGWRDQSGLFKNNGLDLRIWLEQNSDSDAYYFNLTNSNDDVNTSIMNKKAGFSIRCVYNP